MQVSGRRDLKILLDEMYAGLKEHFEALGYQVTTAQEAGLKAARDKEVVEYAGKNGLVLITQDPKPAELADLIGVKCILVSRAMIVRIADTEIRARFGK